MKIKLFVAREFQYFELGIFSFNSYVYYLTRGFIASTRAFNLLTHAFNLPTRAFSLPTRAFNLTTRAFSLLTRGFELVTRVLLFHQKIKVSHERLLVKLLSRCGSMDKIISCHQLFLMKNIESKKVFTVLFKIGLSRDIINKPSLISKLILLDKRLKNVKQSAISDHLLTCDCNINFNDFTISSKDSNNINLLINENLYLVINPF